MYLSVLSSEANLMECAPESKVVSTTSVASTFSLSHEFVPDSKLPFNKRFEAEVILPDTSLFLPVKYV